MAVAVRWTAARTPVPGISFVRDIENPGSPMHESAHFISRRTLFGFGGFPMPDSCAGYPPPKDTLAYLRSFADACGLTERGSSGWRSGTRSAIAARTNSGAGGC